MESKYFFTESFSPLLFLSSVSCSSKATPLLINDVLGEDVINARYCLYQKGDPEALAEIL